MIRGRGRRLAPAGVIPDPDTVTSSPGCQAGPVLREFPLPASASDRLAPDGRPGQPGPPIRDAATVMLVRDGADGVEVFAFRRVPRMAFAPGMLVFPGGSVAPGDAGTPFLEEPAEDAAAIAAAVRETFEECGVLLAVAAAGAAPDAGVLASPV